MSRSTSSSTVARSGSFTEGRTTPNTSQADVPSVPRDKDSKLNSNCDAGVSSITRSSPIISSHQRISDSLERYLRDPVLPIPRSHYRRMNAGKTERQAMARMDDILKSISL